MASLSVEEAGLPPGGEVVLRDGAPVATLRAVEPPAARPPRRLGTLRGTVLDISPDFDATPEGFEDYM